MKKVVSIKSNDDKLITIDIVCHGVPSPGIFKQHVSYIENKYGKIKSYLFRDKQKGWRGQNITITTETGVVPDEDAKLFSSLYFNSLIIRPSCFECPFSSIVREGDITISDYWGIAKENEAFDDNRGVSTVMINSEKGNILFDTIKDSCIVCGIYADCSNTVSAFYSYIIQLGLCCVVGYYYWNNTIHTVFLFPFLAFINQC